MYEVEIDGKIVSMTPDEWFAYLQSLSTPPTISGENNE